MRSQGSLGQVCERQIYSPLSYHWPQQCILIYFIQLGKTDLISLLHWELLEQQMAYQSHTHNPLLKPPHIISSFCFCLGTTPSSVQGSFLALSSKITPGEAQGPYGVLGSSPRLLHARQVPCLLSGLFSCFVPGMETRFLTHTSLAYVLPEAYPTSHCYL